MRRIVIITYHYSNYVGTASDALHTESTSKTIVNSKRKERQREAEREAREMSDYLQRLEVESKKIKNELQQSRTSEVELKSQVSDSTFIVSLIISLFPSS